MTRKMETIVGVVDANPSDPDTPDTDEMYGEHYVWVMKLRQNPEKPSDQTLVRELRLLEDIPAVSAEESNH